MRTVCATFLYTFIPGVLLVAGLAAQAASAGQPRWAESQALLRQIGGDQQALLVAELTGDGRPDLLLGGEGQDLLVNRGGMLFEALQPGLPEPAGLVAGMRAADFDGDGDQDLLRWTRSGALPGHFELLRNEAGRSFTRGTGKVLAAVTGTVQAVAVGDVDGDGDADLLLAMAKGLRLLSNQGQGSFLDRSAAWLPGAGRALALDLQLVDLDLDADLDLVLANRRAVAGVDIVYENVGGGRLKDVTAQRLKAAPTTARRVAVADFDGSGRPDLLLMDDWGLLLGLEDGKGSYGLRNLPVYIVVQAADLLVHDHDADGDPDIQLIRPVASYGHQLLENDGRAGFRDVTSSKPGLPSLGCERAEAADLDGDGRAELICLGQAGRLELYRNDPQRGLVHSSRAEYAIAASKVAWSLPLDLDGDGDADLICPQGVWRNDGRGGFVPTTLLRDELARSSAALAFDADGDGDQDLFVAKEGLVVFKHPAGAQNLLLLNDGRGGFVDASRSCLPQRFDTTVAVSAVDLDLDGDLDLVLSNSALPNAQAKVGITLLHNDGQGRFGDQTGLLPPQNYDTRDVLVADLDGRYGPDLIAVDVDQLRFYQRNAQGGYAPVVKYLGAMPGRLADAALFDADSDGDPDLVIAGSKGLRYLRNDGLGGFSDAPRVLFPSFDAPVAGIDALDLDGNGYPDLLLSHPYQKPRLICDYGGVFLERSDWLQGLVGQESFALADLDLDGDRDLLVSRGDAGLQVLLGLERQLHLALPAKAGEACVLDLHFWFGNPAPGDAAVLAFGLRPARLALPELGTLGLVPELLLAPRPLTTAQGRLSYRFDLPPGFELGAGVYAQALLLGWAGPRLSNCVGLRLR